MGVVFVIVWGLCLLLCGGVVFVIVWGLCLLLCGGVVFVIVWGLCLLLCGGCVCYCVGVVFVIVIFDWLLKFSNVVWDKIVEVRGCSFIKCCLYQFEIGAVDKGLLDLSMSHFFCPSILCVSIVFEVH